MAVVRHRMLIVDDQPDNLDLLLRLFQNEFDVHRASHADQALDLLRESPYEVIITDQLMPGMTGVELLQKSMQYAPDAIRIVITAYPDLGAAVSSINDARAFRFMTKPLDTHELLAQVKGGVRTLELERENRRLVAELKSKTTLLEGILEERGGVIEARVNLRTRQLEAEIERLRARLVHDESGALMRAHFVERVAEEIARAARFSSPVGIIAIAVPLIPLVELEHGRERAEAVAQTVVQVLRMGSRRFDVVGRLGVDRLAVLLPHADRGGAQGRLERFRHAIGQFPLESLEDVLSGQPLEVHGAAATYPAEGVTPATLIDAAERALDAELPHSEGDDMLY